MLKNQRYNCDLALFGYSFIFSHIWLEKDVHLHVCTDISEKQKTKNKQTKKTYLTWLQSFSGARLSFDSWSIVLCQLKYIVCQLKHSCMLVDAFPYVSWCVPVCLFIQISMSVDIYLYVSWYTSLHQLMHTSKSVDTFVYISWYIPQHQLIIELVYLYF